MINKLIKKYVLKIIFLQIQIYVNTNKKRKKILSEFNTPAARSYKLAEGTEKIIK